MESKRDLTRELLADCFKSLMLTTPFDKITIKMITDQAGLIRPTFYKHFQDKYEVLEWIFKTEVVDTVDLLLKNHMEHDAIVIFCKCLEKDRKFYRRAYTVEGPNSFDNLMNRYIHSLFLRYLKSHPVKKLNAPAILTDELAASYYTYSFTQMLRAWLVDNLDYTAEEIASVYTYLTVHPLLAEPEAEAQTGK